MQMRTPTPRLVMEVARNMREKDREEIFNIRWNDSLDDLVTDCLWTKFCWVACLDGEPIAVIGAIPKHPGAWSAFMFATDDFPKIQYDMTKFTQRVIIKTLRVQGARHIQCYSLGSHDVAHRWVAATRPVRPGDAKKNASGR